MEHKYLQTSKYSKSLNQVPAQLNRKKKKILKEREALFSKLPLRNVVIKSICTEAFF